MEVITMESDVSKIEQIADFVAEAKLPSEEKKEAWLDSNLLFCHLATIRRKWNFTRVIQRVTLFVTILLF